MTKEADLERLSAVFEPGRWKIIQCLREKPAHAIDLGKTLNLPRSTVMYHLGVLEEEGLVKGRYKILQEPKSKGKAARIYSVDEPRFLSLLKAAESLTYEAFSVHGKA